MTELALQGDIISIQDLKSAIIEVKKYATWYSQTEVKMRFSKSNEYQPPVISSAATNIISNWAQDNPINDKSLSELIIELENYSAHAPSMTITLAAPAPNSLKRTIIDWCRTNIDPKILVDFKFNSTMLGGMVVQFGSHVHDWSFRRQILTNKDKFPGILKNA
jgi:hypothetical protein